MAKVIKTKGIKPRLLVLLLIFGLGFFLRWYRLSSYPAGFHSQEAIVGYRAYSLLTTGNDELGRRWPLLFTSFQDYQLPVQTYLTLVSVKMFGLSVAAVRLPSAVLGSLAILALYGVVRRLFPDRDKLATWTALLMAVVPWSIFFSRIAFPEGLSFFLFLIGLYFLLKSEKNIFYFLGSVLFFSLSVYTAKIACFFIFPFLFFSWLKERELKLEKGVVKKIFLTVIIFFLPLFLSYLRLPSLKRSLIDNDFSLFSDVGIGNGINSMRGNELEKGSPILGKIFFNKGFWGIKVLENFLGNFTFGFYFAKGEQNPLHGWQNFGPLYFILLGPAFYGLYLFLVNKTGYRSLLGFWFCLIAFFSSFMKTSPDQSKMIFGLPVLLILTGWGIDTLKNKKIMMFFIIGLVFNFCFVFYDAVVKEPIRSQNNWFSGFERVPEELEKLSFQEFDKVYLTDGYAPDPLPLWLFYSRYPAQRLFNYYDGKLLSYRFWMNQIDSIHVGRIEELRAETKEKALFVVTPKEEESLLSRLLLVDQLGRPTQENCYEINRKLLGKDGEVLLLFAIKIGDNCTLVDSKK